MARIGVEGVVGLVSAGGLLVAALITTALPTTALEQLPSVGVAVFGLRSRLDLRSFI